MAKTPDVGAAAPDFTLPGVVMSGGRAERGEYTLSAQRGHPLVLAFYPGDNTPVCTRQLCSYTSELDSFTSFGNGSGLPEDLEGGLARLDIRIHPAGTSRTFAGSLQIHCAINNPSSVEGVTASAGGEAFTMPLFGETLFINQDSDPAPG